MDKREHRFIIKFLWLQGLGEKAIHAQLSNRLAGTAQSLSTVQRQFRRFKDGNTLCEDAERPSRSMVVIGDILRKFFAGYSFASAELIGGSGSSQ
jgi:hypothetical protein